MLHVNCLLRFVHPSRKIPNVHPGLIGARKHFGWAYLRWGLYRGIIFGGSFGLTDDLCMPKIHQSEGLVTIFKK